MRSTAGLALLTVALTVLSPVAALADWASTIAASNPLHWWQFEETTGTMVADSGSGGLSGTLVGGASLDQPGLVGRALRLDGATNAHVLLEGTPLEVPWTLEAIFFQDDTTPSASSALLGPVTFGAPNTAIKSEQWNNTGQLGYTAYGVADVTFDGPPAATPTSYSHVVMVGTAAGVSLYVDGVLADTKDTSIALPRGIIGLGGFIGTTPIDALGGFIDELVIYDRALSAEEIAAHTAAIPEPTSVALLALGAVGIMIVRRRTCFSHSGKNGR